MNEASSFSTGRPKQTVVILVILGILAGAGFLGYRKVMDWHEKTVETALAVQEQAFSEKQAALADETERLKEALAKQAPPAATPERLTEVFGTPEAGAPEHPPLDDCEAIKERIIHFFSYMETSAPEAGGFPNFPEGMFQLLRKLSSRLPMITDETRDIVSLKQNEAHFYRVLGKDANRGILAVLAAEPDVLEPALADFYQYHVEKNCCTTDTGVPCVSLDTLYTYAGFFLETLAGKSYLFRRAAWLRCLAEYYAVRVLDKAGDAGINPYGIDIRPHIDRALDSIQSQSWLAFQSTYEAVLVELKGKYAAGNDFSPDTLQDPRLF